VPTVLPLSWKEASAGAANAVAYATRYHSDWFGKGAQHLKKGGERHTNRQPIRSLAAVCRWHYPSRSCVTKSGVTIRTNACIFSAWRVGSLQVLCPPLFEAWVRGLEARGVRSIGYVSLCDAHPAGLRSGLRPRGATCAGNDPRCHACRTAGKCAMPPLPRRRPRAPAWRIAAEDWIRATPGRYPILRWWSIGIRSRCRRELQHPRCRSVTRWRPTRRTAPVPLTRGGLA
jgi:hypothetical protein